MLDRDRSSIGQKPCPAPESARSRCAAAPSPSLASLVLVALCLTLGALGCGVTDPVISIEFGVAPELFEGAEVEIDGEVVGTLESIGQHTRTGFRVKKGAREVRIVHPELEGEATRVEVELAGRPYVLMADLADYYDEKTRTFTQKIVLQ